MKGNDKNKVERLAERVLCQLNYLELKVIRAKGVGVFCNLTIREMRNAFDETCHDRPTMMHLPPLKVNKFFKDKARERKNVLLGGMSRATMQRSLSSNSLTKSPIVISFIDQQNEEA